MKINKEELKQKYIVECMSITACATFFNASPTTVKRHLKSFGIKKDKDSTRKTMSKSQKVFIDKEDLVSFYIEENLSLTECAKKLGVSPNIVKRRLRDFGIKKPQEKFKEIHKLHANCDETTIAKRKETVLKKYSVDNVSKSKEVKGKKSKTTKEHYGVSNPFQSQTIKNKMCDTFCSKYGVPYSCMRKECRKYSKNNSKPNKEFADMLKGIDYVREFALDKYSYDFKIGDVLFEINPSVFHNATFSPVGQPKDKMYHINKTNVAKENGYRCIHVFDWDDKEKIINLFLENKEKCYARKCSVLEISKEETIDFLSKNHLQGYAKDLIRIGLKCNGELVALMTFDVPRYNKKYEYELVRYCTSKNIVGGAEKIFKYFLDKYSPKNIISYCDLSKFDGNVYHTLGFVAINKPQPSAHWYNLKTKQHITDNLLRQRGYDQLFHSNYGKGMSNEELMIQNGFVKIYDCGQLALVYNQIN